MPHLLPVYAVWALPPRADFIRSFLLARAQLLPEAQANVNAPDPKKKLGHPAVSEELVEEAGFASLEMRYSISLHNYNFIAPAADFDMVIIIPPTFFKVRREIVCHSQLLLQ